MLIVSFPLERGVLAAPRRSENQAEPIARQTREAAAEGVGAEQVPRPGQVGLSRGAERGRNLFPDNIIRAMFQQEQTLTVSSTVNGSQVEIFEKKWEDGVNVLGIISFCIVFGLVCSRLGKPAKPLVDLFMALDQVITQIVRLIMWSLLPAFLQVSQVRTNWHRVADRGEDAVRRGLVGHGADARHLHAYRHSRSSPAGLHHPPPRVLHRSETEPVLVALLSVARHRHGPRHLVECGHSASDLPLPAQLRHR